MAKKKKAEEHENLERWLVSYSDFMTLLFATFVALYAITQVDATDFAKLEESLRSAFNSNTIMEGQEAILNGHDSIFDQQQANSFIPSLMVEYMSPKYEDDSFKEINEEVSELSKMGELEGISSKMTDKGLLITFDDKYLFAPASAALDANAKKMLDKVGVLICKKFILHKMIVEGHTDSNVIHSSIYPSNWELSSARASAVVRYLINRFKFTPSLFSATGYADTRPLAESISPKDAKNRRVEILILKNKYKGNYETGKPFELSLSKAQQDAIQQEREHIIKNVEINSISPEARKLLNNNKKRITEQKSEKLSKKNMEIYVKLYDEEPADVNMPKITQKRNKKLNSSIRDDEDLGL